LKGCCPNCGEGVVYLGTNRIIGATLAYLKDYFWGIFKKTFFNKFSKKFFKLIFFDILLYQGLCKRFQDICNLKKN
jgi:hypothetical protein